MMQAPEMRQNAHYTYKFNHTMGRHGWLRLTPAYSVKLVEEILDQLDYTPKCVFEPFSGTGTTELVCANRGIPSFAYEINPFLVWFGNVKLRSYSNETIQAFLNQATALVEDLQSVKSYRLPPIFSIERWWNQEQLVFLGRLKKRITHLEESEIKDLIMVAFCRTVIDLSNAAFNHVSTSFSDGRENIYHDGMGEQLFIGACKMIADTARVAPQITAKVYNRDSRNLLTLDMLSTYDTVITSPPYPNRISYIRELRPYMYWLDYLKSADDASDLDWRTIGGTWGKATSLLASWEEKDKKLPCYLYDIAHKIANADNRSAGLMANYVLKYFSDMYEHLQSVYQGLEHGGKVFYIIGNSNFYGVAVPAERIYIDMMHDIGFVDAESAIVRKRNCNKQLFEYVVTAGKR